MKRDTVTAYRQRAAATERAIDAAVAEVKAERDAAYTAAKLAARDAEAARVKFSAEELAGAAFVRDRHGWHRVVRVNAKTVTVETPYSWTTAIRIDRVVEFRTP